jgi:hypothetical protein
MSTKTSATPYFQTMSPVPPEPQATQAPPSFVDESKPTKPSSPFPSPKLRLELRDLCHKSTSLFLKNFDASEDFATLVQTVLSRLYTVKGDSSHDEASTSRPTRSHVKIPGTRSVTLILRDMDGVAYTTGSDLDDDHKEIHLSLDYLAHVASNQHLQPARAEILGVVCHELVHCFQWNGRGTCNGGLIEGIADWVRLNAGFVPPHWKKEAGKTWDSGYQNTGYFLDWIETSRGRGSVFKINQALCNQEYKDDVFWKDLFGQSVDSLWKEYTESLKKAKGDSGKDKDDSKTDKDDSKTDKDEPKTDTDEPKTDKDESEKYGDANLKMQIRIKKDVEGHA